jgi:hypothetical protein
MKIITFLLFDIDGSEFGSRANSVLGSNSNSNQSEFPETGKKFKKNRISNELNMISAAGSSVINKSHLNNDKLDISSKKFKIFKAKSVDINDEDLNNNQSTLLEASSDKSSKKIPLHKLAKQISVNSTDADPIASIVAAKIVKPSGPTKWSALKIGKANSDGTSINSHD